MDGLWHKILSPSLTRTIVFSQGVSITWLSENEGNLTSVQCVWLFKGNTCAKRSKTVSVTTTMFSALCLPSSESSWFSTWLHNSTCWLITLISLKYLFRENYCLEMATMARCTFLHLQDTIKNFFMCIASSNHFTVCNLRQEPELGILQWAPSS